MEMGFVGAGCVCGKRLGSRSVGSYKRRGFLVGGGLVEFRRKTTVAFNERTRFLMNRGVILEFQRVLVKDVTASPPPWKC